MRKTGHLIRQSWRLASPYFLYSRERWSARILLVAIIALGLISVEVTVQLNFWFGAFYDVLQNYDLNGFFALQFWYYNGQLGFLPIVAVYVPVAILRSYLEQYLSIRWRRWMTNELMTDWMTDRAYYTIGLTRGAADLGTDNPDQRIAEDVRDFTESSLLLGVQLINRVVSVIRFSMILWGLSGAIEILGVTIPGYMFFGAVLYAVIGTWLTHLVGRPLIGLNFLQQKAEADFRFALVRLRENTEGVALSGGEREEREVLSLRFHEVALNWFRIMNRKVKLNLMTLTYGQAAALFPFLLGAPAYFSKKIALGGLTRVVDAFSQVQDSLSWFITVYSSIASWSATVNRLTSFRTAIEGARALEHAGPVVVSGGDGVSLREARIQLPDGTTILENAEMVLRRGEALTITGPSGAGKSTIFRAIAGIWPFGSGRIERAPGTYLFLPQRPYVPLGSLRHAVTYPAATESVPETELRDALEAVGLGSLAGRIDEEQPWTQILSGGEQQRLAMARALLLRPDWLFLDEATSNLDTEAEAMLYGAIKQRLPETTVVSIAHRPDVARFHDETVHFARSPGHAGRLDRLQPETTMASTAAP